MRTSVKIQLLIGLILSLSATSLLADGWDPISKAGAINSIADTRHNMTVSYSSGGHVMDGFRNDYGGVCIYCHTPHGANKQIQAPLWNRTVSYGNYMIYDKPTTLMRPVDQPGPSSLTCLSCHDGTIAIDSVLNMPYAGRSPDNSGATNNELGTSNTAFLDSWAANPAGLATANNHLALGFEFGGNPGPGPSTPGCAHCHDGSPNGFTVPVPDFRAFMLGTDLRNEHPVGITFPDTYTPATDFNEPDVKLPGKMAFFDTNGNNYADKDEVRLYDSGNGYKVECASCHDPHGVESGGVGTSTRFSPSFLRVNNGIAGNHAGTAGIVSHGASALCLTCHTK